MAAKKYKKAAEVQIEGNKIFSPVRHKWLTLTPEIKAILEDAGAVLGGGSA